MTRMRAWALALLVTSAVAVTATPATASTGPPQAPSERVGSDTLLPAGEGTLLELCGVCVRHGFGFELPPSATGGLVTALTLHLGAGPEQPLCRTDEHAVYLAPRSGKEIIADSLLPARLLPAEAALVRFALSQPVPVKRGEILTGSLLWTGTTCGTGVFATTDDSSRSRLCFYRLSICWPIDGLQLQVRTQLVGR